MKINKKYITIGILIALILFFSSYVYAFGVSYIFGSQISLSPGETTDIYASLQNFIGGENISVKADITEGSEIAKITDSSNIYFIQFGEQKKVNIKLSVPNDAKIGNEYNIRIGLATSKEGTKGALGFGMATGVRTKVIVVEKPKTPEELATKKALTQNIYLIIKIIIAAVITGVIIFFIVKKKKAKLKSAEKTTKYREFC